MTVVQLVIKPKKETREYNGYKYVLQFDPHGLDAERWMWTVLYTRTYEYIGRSPTIESASRAAQRRIRELQKDE